MVLIAVAKAMGKVMLIVLTGVLMGIFPRPHGLLHIRVLRDISTLSFYVMFPALVFSSVGKSLDLELLKELWPLIFWSVASMLVPLGCALIIARIFPLRKSLRRVFVLACVFGNTGGLPLLLMESLSQSVSWLADDPLAKDLAVTQIFIFTLAWQVAFWGPGMLFLEQSDDKEEEEEEEEEEEIEVVEVSGNHLQRLELTSKMNEQASPKTKKRAKPNHCRTSLIKIVTSPSIICLCLGGLVGILPPVQSFIFNDGGMSFFGAAAKSIGSPAIVFASLIMAAYLGHSMKDNTTIKQTGGKTDEKAVAERESNELSVEQTILVCCFVRLVLTPALCIAAIVILGDESPLFPRENPLMRLIIVVELGVPSAQSLIVVSSYLGTRFEQTILDLSKLFMIQYGLAVITVSVLTYIAVNMALTT